MKVYDYYKDGELYATFTELHEKERKHFESLYICDTEGSQGCSQEQDTEMIKTANKVKFAMKYILEPVCNEVSTYTHIAHRFVTPLILAGVNWNKLCDIAYEQDRNRQIEMMCYCILSQCTETMENDNTTGYFNALVNHK